MTRFAARALLTSLTCLSLSCASDDGAEKKQHVGRHAFTPADYRLDFLEPEQTAARLSPMVVEKIGAVLDRLENKLPPLLATLPAPAPTLLQMVITRGRPILAEQLEKKLTAIIDEHRAAVEPVVQKYNVFKDPALTYDLIEVGDGDTRSVLERVNARLKEAYRTVRAIRVADKMLVVAKTDAASLKAAPNPAALGGLGVAALSITEISLEAIDDAQRIGPELKALSEELASTMGSNPLLAVQLTPALGAVVDASASLTTVPVDAAKLCSDASELLQLFAPSADAAPPAAP